MQSPVELHTDTNASNCVKRTIKRYDIDGNRLKKAKNIFIYWRFHGFPCRFFFLPHNNKAHLWYLQNTETTVGIRFRTGGTNNVINGNKQRIDVIRFEIHFIRWRPISLRFVWIIFYSFAHNTNCQVLSLIPPYCNTYVLFIVFCNGTDTARTNYFSKKY